MVDLGKYEPIATAPRDGTLVWVFSELIGEVLARHIGVGAWRGCGRLILPTHWRSATAAEIATFERENPQSDELQTIALRLKSCSLVARPVIDAPAGNVSHATPKSRWLPRWVSDRAAETAGSLSIYPIT